jgi:hypothetical protein
MASHRLFVSLAAVGVLALATLYALPALRKSPPAGNSSIRPQANDSQQLPKQEQLPENPSPPASEPAKIAPAAASTVRKPETPKIIQSPPKPIEAKPVSEYAGFSVHDIPLLLKKAEKDAGAGDYDSSRREYEIILHLEPNNQAAKTGMSRLNLSVDRK